MEVDTEVPLIDGLFFDGEAVGGELFVLFIGDGGSGFDDNLTGFYVDGDGLDLVKDLLNFLVGGLIVVREVRDDSSLEYTEKGAIGFGVDVENAYVAAEGEESVFAGESFGFGGVVEDFYGKEIRSVGIVIELSLTGIHDTGEADVF